MKEKGKEQLRKQQEELDYKVALSTARMERAIIRYEIKSKAEVPWGEQVEKTPL